MPNFHYVIDEKGRFVDEIVGLNEGELGDPSFLVPIAEFPIPEGAVNPEFTGSGWISTELPEAEKIFTQEDLLKALASGDMSIVQKVAAAMVNQIDLANKQAIAADEKQRKAIERKKAAIATVRKVGTVPQVSQNEPKSTRKKAKVEPLEV